MDRTKYTLCALLARMSERHSTLIFGILVRFRLDVEITGLRSASASRLAAVPMFYEVAIFWPTAYAGCTGTFENQRTPARSLQVYREQRRRRRSRCCT